jgi:hypothetical protein
MKIWKTSLQGLIEEAKGPIYITSTETKVQSRAGDSSGFPLVIFSVSAAGFNSDGRVVELRIQQPPVIAVFDEEVRCAACASSAALNDLRGRLTTLGIEIRDGAISDKPVIGCLE